MTDYVRLMVTKIKHRMSDELDDMRVATDLSDELVDDILNSAYGLYGSSDPEAF